MTKGTIDLNKTVYDLCKEYSELPQILDTIGFHDIIKPGMLLSVGRFMTIPKGAAAKKIDLQEICKVLQNHGYQINS